MTLNFSNEVVFSHQPPNLCLLGNENDFKKLALLIIDLTDSSIERKFILNDLDFIRFNTNKSVVFSSGKAANQYGIFAENGDILFKLDSNYWERIFKFFVPMSWDKRTYYLNYYEDCLKDIELKQDINLICSSEF